MPQVTVIVPLFNGIDYLPTFFASFRAALPDGAQLILVDDASAQPVWETVPDFGGAESVIRLQNDHNVGYSAAVNRAFAQTTGESSCSSTPTSCSARLHRGDGRPDRARV